MRVITPSQNLQKTNSTKFQKGGGGGAPGTPVLDPPLNTNKSCWNKSEQHAHHDLCRHVQEDMRGESLKRIFINTISIAA